MPTHRVGAANEIADGEKLHLHLEERYITVYKVKGSWYALDSTCYHAGGPQASGDIEEVAGQHCVVCPWHQYKVQLATGEKVYEESAGVWKSAGKRQRTHHVEAREDGLYVTLQLEGKWASDEYASRADCGERLRVKQMKSIGGYAYPTSPASPRDKSPRG